MEAVLSFLFLYTIAILLPYSNKSAVLPTGMRALRGHSILLILRSSLLWYKAICGAIGDYLEWRSKRDKGIWRLAPSACCRSCCNAKNSEVDGDRGRQ